jgi:hypothetical protein
MYKKPDAKNARLPRRENSPLPLMLTLTRLAVGLEPPSVPDAAGTVRPNPFPEFWVPRWSASRTIKQTKNCISVGTHLPQVKQLPGNFRETYKKYINKTVVFVLFFRKKIHGWPSLIYLRLASFTRISTCRPAAKAAAK